MVMGYDHDRHTIGFAGPEAGVRDSYRPERDSLAQAEYEAALEKEGKPASKAGPGARIGGFLRRLFARSDSL